MTKFKKVIIVFSFALVIIVAGFTALHVYTQNAVADASEYISANLIDSEFKNDWLNAMTIESIGNVNPINGTLRVEIKSTLLGEVANFALADSGLRKDYENAILDGRSEEDVAESLTEYVKSIITSKLYLQTSEVTVIAPINGIADFSALDPIIQNINQFTVSDILANLSTYEESDNSVVMQDVISEVSALPIIASDSVFCYEENDSMFLISDICIQTGEPALDSIRTLSDVNKQIVTNDYVLYITYNVTNLSDKTAMTHNAFKLASEGKISRLTKNIVGLQSVVELESGETTSMSCFLAGPTNSILYWYDENICGSYEVSVVQ